MTNHLPPAARPAAPPVAGPHHRARRPAHRRTAMTSIASHVDLLEASGALRRAAAGGDVDRIHRELVRLRTDLVEHLHAGRAAVSRLPGATATVAGEGQRRLLALLDDLLADTYDDLTSCNCLVRAAEVGAALRRQARLEAAVFADPVRTEAG